MRKNSIKKNKLIKKFFLVCILIYAFIILINQQKTLMSYKNMQKYYSDKIDVAKQYNKSLNLTKENLNSDTYIETTAREKLDMYYSNERIYKNINK